MTQKLGLLNKDCKAAIIKMYQGSIIKLFKQINSGIKYQPFKKIINKKKLFLTKASYLLYFVSATPLFYLALLLIIYSDS